jgi:hypothetical protein
LRIFLRWRAKVCSRIVSFPDSTVDRCDHEAHTVSQGDLRDWPFVFAIGDTRIRFAIQKAQRELREEPRALTVPL